MPCNRLSTFPGPAPKILPDSREQLVGGKLKLAAKKFSPCKSLGQLSKAIQGIQVRAFTVSSQ